MPRITRDEFSLEQVVREIRTARLKRFFSFSDSELENLTSQHESVLPFLYEIYYRYGERMDERMKSAVAIYMLCRGADFETVYRSLKSDASNRDEVMGKLRNAEKSVIYN